MDYSIKIQGMELAKKYRENLYKNPKLICLFFELTDACNLCCRHCGSSASPNRRVYLPFEQIKKVMDRVASVYDPRHIMVCLSGGEPFMHPDFFEIIRYAKSLHYNCGVTTNGTLIDLKTAHKLKEVGLDTIAFSLDGLKESHNYLRNRPWAFDKTIEGIKNLRSVVGKEMVLQITTVIHKKNFDELEDIFNLAQSLGVDSWRPVNVEPIGRALENKDMILDPNQMKELLDFIIKKRFDRNVKMNVTYGCSHYLTPKYERMVRNNYFICGSGIYVGSVLCNGDIYSCIDIERRKELVQGNIYEDDFVDVWENRFKEFRKDRTLDCEKCLNCEDRGYCRGDSAHTWDYNRNEPLLCMKEFLLENEV